MTTVQAAQREEASGRGHVGPVATRRAGRFHSLAQDQPLVSTHPRVCEFKGDWRVTPPVGRGSSHGAVAQYGSEALATTRGAKAPANGAGALAVIRDDERAGSPRHWPPFLFGEARIAPKPGGVRRGRSPLACRGV
jgi:hypothetical protein